MSVSMTFIALFRMNDVIADSYHRVAKIIDSDAVELHTSTHFKRLV